MANIPDEVQWPAALEWPPRAKSGPTGAALVREGAATSHRSANGDWRLRLDYALTTLILFMMSGALIGPLVDPAQIGGDDNPWLRTMWLPIYGLIAVLAAVQWRAMVRAWLPLILVSLLIGLAWASSCWSIEPAVTGRRAMALAFTSLFGLYLAVRWSWRDFVSQIALLGFLLAIGSYAACLGYPIMGVHQDVNAGDWRGLWYEKNALGQIMAIGVLASTAAALVRPQRRLRWAMNAALCLGLVIMSRSGTALIAVAVIFGGAAALGLMRRGPVIGVATLFGLGAAAFAVAVAQMLSPGVFLNLIGKDATLTGRTNIWAAILRQASTHPWLGFGYAAFWEKTSAPANFVRAETGWLVPSAHNGWLDMLVQLGVVGVALCAALLALAFVVAIFRCLDDRDGDWALIFLTIFLITAVSESVLMQRNSLIWTLCIATLAKLLSEPRARRRGGIGGVLESTEAAAAPSERRLSPLWPPEPQSFSPQNTV